MEEKKILTKAELELLKLTNFIIEKYPDTVKGDCSCVDIAIELLTKHGV